MFDIYTSVNSHKHDGIQEQVYSIRIQNGKNSQNVVLLNEHPKRNQRNAREYALVFKYLYQHQYNGKDIVIKCPGNSSRTLANIRIYGQKNWPLSKRTSYEQYIHFKLTGQRDHGIPKDSVDNGQLKLMKIAYHYLTKLGINDITVSPCDRQDPEFQQLRQFNRDYMRHNGSTKQSGSRQPNPDIPKSLREKFYMACLINHQTKSQAAAVCMINYIQATRKKALKNVNNL